MNHLVGKSTGIALLMAAALLAALFAMGVFAPAGVNAQFTSGFTTAALVDTPDPGADVKITVRFQVDNEIDGLGTDGEPASENISIQIPIGTAAANFTKTDSFSASAIQRNKEVGNVTITDENTIIIGTGGTNPPILAGAPVAVTVTGLKNPLANGNYPIMVFQQVPATGLYTVAPAAQPSVDVYEGLTGQEASVSPNTPDASGVTMTLEFTPGEVGATNDVVITLPVEAGYNLPAGDAPFGSDAANWLVKLNGTVQDGSETTPIEYVENGGDADTIAIPGERLAEDTKYTLTIGPAAPANGNTPAGYTNPPAGEFTAMFQAGDSSDLSATGRTALEAKFSVAPPSLEYDATDATEPGSNQSLTVRGKVEFADSDNITVNLSKFGVPSSIDVDHVTVSVGGSNSANPSDVEIDDKKVTLVAPFEADVAGSDDTEKLEADATQLTTITFRRSAAITLPTLDGTYDIKVSTSESPEGKAEAEKSFGGDSVKNTVVVKRQVKVSPASATRGTEITITGKGFADGSATLKIEDNVRTGSLDVVDGAFTYTVLTDVKNTSGDNVFGMGANDITVNDSKGKTADAAVHTVKASFSISPEDISPGEKVVITLKDAPAAEKPTTVRFAGDTTTQVTGTGIGDADDTLTTTWDVTVPDLGRTGTLEMRVVVDGIDDLTKNVMVATKDLTLNPSTAVAGQDVTIQGSGFSGSGTQDTSITIDGGDRLAGTDDITVDSGGSMSVTITLPESATAGDRRIQFKDTVGRIGRATLTIPKATLSVEPDESLIGSPITVSGEGFPANDLVQITYAEGPGASAADRPIGTATTGPTGVFETTVRVPSFALTGESHKVAATSQLAKVEDNRVSAKSKHSTPDPDVTFSPSQVEAGGLVTISGINFTGFRAVESITIGSASILPVPAPTSDGNGSFTASNVLIPQLDPGNYTVKITVGDDVVTKFLAIVEAVEETVSDPAEVFAPLGDRLVRVWYLDQDTGNWLFYDPDPDLANFNNLTVLPLQEVVVIIISEGENIDFPATTPAFLQPGTNNRLLN